MTVFSGRGRGALALAMSAGLLVACSGGDAERDRADSSPPSEASASGRAGLPSVPATDDPQRLARQLDLAYSTLRASGTSPADVRRAAEFQQLAVRALAHASPGFRRTVTRLLDPPDARDTRADAAAARLLLSMVTDPSEELPRWRIVRPPPPRELLGYYRLAQRRTGIHWTYLAAIHLVETRMGRIRGVSTAGALGPMQFMPATWEMYGAGGDVRDPRDAILAAGRLLVANGAPGDMAGALRHYNASDAYVGAVLSYARTMRRSPDAYRRYWHWRVLYAHERGTYVLPVGYPERRAVLLPERGEQPASRSHAARGAVAPPWLGTRVLPETAQGYGEVRPTPAVMRVRRWNTPDPIPPLPGAGFKAVVAAPAPDRVLDRSTWRPGCPVDRSDLAWIRMTYWGFDQDRHSGEMLVNRAVAADLVQVFRRLYRARFPIETMGIAGRADLDAPPTGDGNGTGAFVCRPVRGGSEFSQHAYGLAVDLDPFQNPYTNGDVVLPELASAYLDRDWVRPGMVTPGGPAVRAFASVGWEWGGDWSSLKDYQHFSLDGR